MAFQYIPGQGVNLQGLTDFSNVVPQSKNEMTPANLMSPETLMPLLKGLSGLFSPGMQSTGQSMGPVASLAAAEAAQNAPNIGGGPEALRATMGQQNQQGQSISDLWGILANILKAGG